MLYLRNSSLDRTHAIRYTIHTLYLFVRDDLDLMASLVHTLLCTHNLHHLGGIIRTGHRDLGGCTQLDAVQFGPLTTNDEAMVLFRDLQVIVGL